EWHDLRARIPYSASMAPIIMGASSKGTRSELLRILSGYEEKNYPQWVLDVLFPRGHEIEEATRPMIEAEIDDELFPVTGSATFGEFELLASYDGMTMLGDLNWECKSWNAKKAEAVRNGDIPDEDYWQVVHQALVNMDAEHSMYTVSDGKNKRESVTLARSDFGGHFDTLLAAWRQFDADLRNYEHEEKPAEVVGSAPSEVPSLHIELAGEVTASNLPAVRETAIARIQSINTDLATDEDFADAEATVKWCKKLEDRIKAAKEHALSQTESIDALFRTMDEIAGEARKARLSLDKQVKARKDEIRAEIIEKRLADLQEHYRQINDGINGAALQEPADARQRIAAAMKNKRTIVSLRDAADQAVADMKLEANDRADNAHAVLKRIDAVADEHRHLFPDRVGLITADPAQIEDTIKARIADHQQAVAERERAEKQREAEERERRARLDAMEVANAERESDERKAASPVVQPAEDDMAEIVGNENVIDASNVYTTARNYPAPDTFDEVIGWAQHHGATITPDARNELMDILNVVEELA
ncbi:MAG TPA: hypothetical protein VK972_09925, partial [Wenzhouxiangella sp.]|nr:hypothetical protein [Wenzhouxiangella sp.]